MANQKSLADTTLIGHKYRIGRKIGSGSFGEIFAGGVLHQDSTQQVAIKFEKKSARCPQLRHEFKVYRELQGCTGIGQVLYYGSFRDCNVMVMELLGPSLEDLFNKCGRKFSLRTTLKLADQLLHRVETLHENHLIHRDIKPANFVMGLNDSTTVNCIDFGLSKRYRHPHTLQHIPYREGRTLTGTPRYASIANHRGIETSRRDDLESIGYILVYFLVGKLPWQGLKLPANVNGTASQKHKLILDKKEATALSDLCKECPKEFEDYLKYCRELDFDGKPDMLYLRGLFRQLYENQSYKGGVDWDWQRDPARPSTEPIRSSRTVKQPQSKPPQTVSSPKQERTGCHTQENGHGIEKVIQNEPGESSFIIGTGLGHRPGSTEPGNQQQVNYSPQIAEMQNVSGYYPPKTAGSRGTDKLSLVIPSVRLSEPQSNGPDSIALSMHHANSLPSSDAVGITSGGSRPRTAQNDTTATAQGVISLATPRNVNYSAGQIGSQAIAPSPRCSQAGGWSTSSGACNAPTQPDVKIERQESRSHAERVPDSNAHSTHVVASQPGQVNTDIGCSRPISSREQVVVSVSPKLGKLHQNSSLKEHSAATLGNSESIRRLNTESGGATRLQHDRRDVVPRAVEGSENDKGRRNIVSSRGGPQAWGDTTGAHSGTYRAAHASCNDDPIRSDEAILVSQHAVTRTHGDKTGYRTNASSACNGSAQQMHFVGSPLSLVRHRRATSRDESGGKRQRRPHSGHACVQQHSSSRNGNQGVHAYTLPHHSKSLWGRLQEGNPQTAWAMSNGNGHCRARAPMRPSSGFRATSAHSRTGRTAIPQTRVRHVY